MNAKVCVSISSNDTDQLLRRVRRAERLSADLVEVRLDKLERNNGLSKIARAAGTPLIATNKHVLENGSFDGSEDERVQLLFEAVDEGFQYVDLDFTTNKLGHIVKAFRNRGAKIILSYHDHSRTPTPAKYKSILKQLRSYKPDVCKIVTTARVPEDNLMILELLRMHRNSIPLVSFAMGKAGVWSRLLAPFYGARFTYASLGRGLETAPGQRSIAELRRIYTMLGVE